MFRWVRAARWSLAVLAAAVSMDALLTLVEVLVYNAPRARTAVDALLLVVAFLAPTFAAVTLWGAVVRAGSSESARPLIVSAPHDEEARAHHRHHRAGR